MNVNFQKIISSCLLVTFLNAHLASTLAAIVPASHDEVLAFRANEEIDFQIKRHISTCGGFHALALFKVAADVLSGNDLEAEGKIKSYFGKESIIDDLTRIVQAVRLGRGYAGGLRTDMNVPTYAMEGYRANLNMIGGFINKDSESATLDHIHTTQKGANFTEHLKLTDQYLHRSTDVSHPRFVFSEAVVVAPVLIKHAEPVIVPPVTILPAPLQVKAAVNSPGGVDSIEEAMVIKPAVAQPMELPKSRKYTAEEYTAWEAELIDELGEAQRERSKRWKIVNQNAKKVRELEERFQASDDKIRRLQGTLQGLSYAYTYRSAYQLQQQQQIKEISEELKIEKEEIKATEAALREARKEAQLAYLQETEATEAWKKIGRRLADLRAAAENDALERIKKRVADLNLGDMPLDEARKSLEFIDKCRAARPATYDVIHDSRYMIQQVSGLLQKCNNFYALQNIQEILRALFSQVSIEQIGIEDGVGRLHSLPKKLVDIKDLGKLFAQLTKQLDLTDSHLLHLISALADIPAEFAEEIIHKCLKKTFYYGITPTHDRIREVMRPIVTEFLEMTKEFEFRELLRTLDAWNMRKEKDELLYLLHGDYYASVRCEDALRWLNEFSQERSLASFVDYFKRKVASERATLKPLTGANDSSLHLLAKTFYVHPGVHFTKEMALAMRSMDFSRYPFESQFVAFRDVYLKLVGRVYYPEYTRSQSPKLLKQLYAASNQFRNCEEMLRLINCYEDLVLAEEVQDTTKYHPSASGLVPTLLVKSRAMVMDSLCKIGEQNETVIIFANNVLCQDFFDTEHLVNCGSVDSETKPYEKAYNSPLGYGRASCNTWNRAQVMEAVARNAESLRNLNRQRVLKYFIRDGAIGEQRAWIVDAFCEVPDRVVDDPDFGSLCQRIAERDGRPKMMQYYTTNYNKKGGLGFLPDACINMYERRDLTDAQKAVILSDLVDMADSADPSYRKEYVRSMSDDPRFQQCSDDKRVQLYAYLFYASEYKHEALPANQHTVSGRTSLIRPASRIARTPLIIVWNETSEQVYKEDPLDFGGHEIVNQDEITYIPDPMHQARVDWVNQWIERGRAQPISVQ